MVRITPEATTVLRAAEALGLRATVEGFDFRYGRALEPVYDPEVLAVTREEIDKTPFAGCYEDFVHHSDLQAADKCSKMLDDIANPIDPVENFTNAGVDPYHHAIEMLAMIFTVRARDLDGTLFRASSLSYEDRFKVPFKDTSAGQTPLIWSGPDSKKDCVVQSHIVVEAAAIRGRGAFVPLKESEKSEKLRKGKTGRLISIDTPYSYLTLQAVFGYHIHSEKNAYLGWFLNQPWTGNTYLVLVQRLTAFMGRKVSFAERVAEIRRRGFHTSDKKGFDKTQSKWVKCLMLLELIARTNIDPYWMPQLSESLASIVYPFVGLAGNSGYYAPNKMPSGNSLTIYGNTAIHEMLISSFLISARKQVFEIGPYDEKEAAVLSSFCIIGDDFISLKNHYSEKLDAYEDHYWGTITEKDNSAELARRHLDLDANCLRKDPHRTLGRLGNNKALAADHIQACISASKEANDKTVTEVCSRIVDRLLKKSPKDAGNSKDKEVRFGHSYLGHHWVHLEHCPNKSVGRDTSSQWQAAINFRASLGEVKTMYGQS